MKLLRKIFLGLIIMLPIAFGALWMPIVQKSIILSKLRKFFDEVHIDKISISPQKTVIEKLYITKGNCDIKISRIDADLFLKNLIFFRELKIKNLKIDGVFFTVNSRTSQPNNESISETFPIQKFEISSIRKKILAVFNVVQFLKHQQLPLKTIIDNVSISILADVNERVISDISITGSGLAPMSTAIFNITSATDIDFLSPISIKTSATAHITQSKDAFLDLFNCDAKCVVNNQTTMASKSFFSNIFSQKKRGMCSYKLTIKEENSAKEECKINIDYDHDKKKLFINSLQNFDASSLEGICVDPIWDSLRVKLKTFGEFELSSGNGLLRINGDIGLPNGSLSSIFPSLKTSLLTTIDSTVKMRNGIVAINSLSGMLIGGDDSVKILYFLTRPLVVWGKMFGYVIENNIHNSGRNLLKLKFDIFDPKFFFHKKSPTKFDGMMSGEFDVSSSNGTFSIKTSAKSPLMIKSLTTSHGPKKICENVDFSCDFQAKLGKLGEEIKLEDILVNDMHGKEVLSGYIDCSHSGLNKEALLNSHIIWQLDSLIELPLFPKEILIKSGICSTEINIDSRNNALKFQALVKLKSLQLDKPQLSKPIDGTADVTYSHDGENGHGNIILNLEGQQKTSIIFGVESKVDNIDSPSVKLELNGTSISIPDVMELCEIPSKMIKLQNVFSALSTKIFGENNQHNPNASDGNIGFLKNKKYKNHNSIKNSILSPFCGTISVDVNKVFITDTLALDNVQGFCGLLENKIDFKAIDFSLANSPFSLDSRLEIDKNDEKFPYHFSLSAFWNIKDSGEICKLIAPNNDPLLDGNGQISVKLSSKARSFSEIFGECQGVARLDMKNGALRLHSNLAKKDKAMVDLIAAINFLLSQKNEKCVHVDRLIKKTQLIEYDEIVAKFVCGNNLNATLEECYITGPELWLTAKGSITYASHKSIFQFPMMIDVQINASGDLGNILENLGLIFDKPRHSKYMQGPSFIIRGTMDNLDFSDISKTLYFLF